MTSSVFKHRPQKQWQKLTITTSPGPVDYLAGIAARMSDGGIEQIDFVDENGQDTTRIIVYLATDDSDRPKKIAELQKILASIPKTFRHATTPPLLTEETILEEDWGEKWKENFKPFKIIPRLVIKPTWEDYRPEPDESVIELDPGMAFGTGQHASTRMALELIDRIYTTREGKCPKVLDVGTGTGILAMAAALFGGTDIIAIDNDPDAVAAAHDNLILNHLTDCARAEITDLTDIPGRFDLVIANIIHDVLVDLAPELIKHLAPGGGLVLSGILAGTQADNIKKIYINKGLTLQESRTSGEWEAISFRLPT